MLAPHPGPLSKERRNPPKTTAVSGEISDVGAGIEPRWSGAEAAQLNWGEPFIYTLAGKKGEDVFSLWT